jgi:hypothetical protein
MGSDSIDLEEHGGKTIHLEVTCPGRFSVIRPRPQALSGVDSAGSDGVPCVPDAGGRRKARARAT